MQTKRRGVECEKDSFAVFYQREQAKEKPPVNVSFCARLDGWYAGGSSLYIILFSPCNKSLRLALSSPFHR